MTERPTGTRSASKRPTLEMPQAADRSAPPSAPRLNARKSSTATLIPPSARQARELRRLADAKWDRPLEQLMQLDGAVACAFVDYERNVALGSRSNLEHYDVAATAVANTGMVRAKLELLNQLEIDAGIDDVVITLETQFHLVVPVVEAKCFAFVVVARNDVSLGMARHQLESIWEGVRRQVAPSVGEDSSGGAWRAS